MYFIVNFRQLKVPHFGLKSWSFLASRKYSESLDSKLAKRTTTVDQNEINFHGNLSNDWWDERGPMKGLHAMNQIRVQFIRTGLINTGLLNEKDTLNDPQYMKGISIADVGCGGGILSLSLARLGCNVVGVEPSQELVNIATDAMKRYSPAGKTEFVASSIEEYAKENFNKYDAVVCSEVIEHVTQKGEFIEGCIKLLKPGGSIFFTTLNRTEPSRLLSIYVAEYLLRILPVGTHSYDKFITPEELSHILEKFSCRTKMVNGFLYNPLNHHYYWVPSPSIHYALHAIKTS